MKQKHVDASRELRLWIGQVVAPLIMCGVMAMSNETVREYAANAKEKITSKFRKK